MNTFYVMLFLGLVALSQLASADPTVLSRQRRGFFSSFEDAKNWFSEKVVVPVRDNVVQPAKQWLTTQWNAHGGQDVERALTATWNASKATLNEKYQSALATIDNYFENSTVDKITAKGRQGYADLAALTARIGDFIKNHSSSVDSVRANAATHLQQLQQLFDDIKGKMPPMPALPIGGRSVTQETPAVNDDDEPSEEEKKAISADLQAKLADLRRQVANSQKLMIENEQ